MPHGFAQRNERGGTRAEAQQDARASATALADELIEAEVILLAMPLYNWGVAAHIKSWYDFTYADTRFSGGALKDKPVVLATVLGGTMTRVLPRWDGPTTLHGSVE